MRRLRVGCAALAALGLAGPGAAQQLGDAARAVLEGAASSRSIEITDGFAEYVRRVTGSSSRVYADVSAVKTYAQAGCKRLQVVVRAPEALARDDTTGQITSFRFTYEIDLCADGSPPQRR